MNSGCSRRHAWNFIDFITLVGTYICFMGLFVCFLISTFNEYNSRITCGELWWFTMTEEYITLRVFFFFISKNFYPKKP